MERIFDTPPVEFTEKKYGNTVLKFAEPTGFAYREYIELIREVFDANPEEMTEDYILKNIPLTKLQEQGEYIHLYQMACCLTRQFEGATVKEIFEQLKINYTTKMLEECGPICVELLMAQRGEGDDDQLDEEVKKPSIQTQDSDTD